MFHSYWNVIGFDRSTKEGIETLNSLVKMAISEPNIEHTLYIDNEQYNEYHKEILPGAGIIVFGYYRENEFVVENTYPYVDATEECILDCYNVSIEQMSDKFAYLGMFDSYIVNMILMFYVKNSCFINSTALDLSLEIDKCKIGLSALSSSGMILLPMEKRVNSENNRKVYRDRKINLIERAKKGDEDAIDTLTIDEMETQQMLFHRVQREDVLSIVESYFMPDGLENDKYSIMGDILDIKKEVNPITEHSIYCMQILSNDIQITVMINEKDLTGEPKTGRRFRGKIWLLGEIKDIENVRY